MDNFLEYFLIFLIIVIIYVCCLCKRKRETFNNTDNMVVVEEEETQNNLLNNSNIENPTECLKRNNKFSIHSEKRKNDLVEFTNGKTYLGPAIHFHQCFNPVNMNDLGWRNWWSQKQNENLVKEPKQFQSIMRNFLDKQENTKNLYF
jgi:hypothetical protein